MDHTNATLFRRVGWFIAYLAHNDVHGGRFNSIKAVVTAGALTKGLLKRITLWTPTKVVTLVKFFSQPSQGFLKSGPLEFETTPPISTRVASLFFEYMLTNN